MLLLVFKILAITCHFRRCLIHHPQTEASTLQSQPSPLPPIPQCLSEPIAYLSLKHPEEEVELGHRGEGRHVNLTQRLADGNRVQLRSAPLQVGAASVLHHRRGGEEICKAQAQLLQRQGAERLNGLKEAGESL